MRLESWQGPGTSAPVGTGDDHMSFLERFGPPIGKALTDAALGYTQGLLDTPKAQEDLDEYAQNRRLRPLEIQQKELGLQKTQADIAKEKAAIDKPIWTPHGLYVKNTQGVYEFQPFPVKDASPVAHEKLMVDWLHSDDPQQQAVARAWLSKMQAPGVRAQTQVDRVGPYIDHLHKQEAYWTRLADNAAQRGSVMAGRYRQHADQVKGELGSLVQAQKWLESGTPEQQEAARRYLERKDRQPRTSGTGGGSQIQIEQSPLGRITRSVYRGRDHTRYVEAFTEAAQKLSTLSEKEATAEVSRKPVGVLRDGWIDAWRT